MSARSSRLALHAHVTALRPLRSRPDLLELEVALAHARFPAPVILRRASYHVAIRVALAHGLAQDAVAREFRASCKEAHHLPWAMFLLVLYLPLRAAFYGMFTLSFALADGLTVEQRERLAPWS